MPRVSDTTLAAMDLTVVMAVTQLADETGCDPTLLLPAFLESQTAADLCDDSLKYWWDGPSAAVERYKTELVKGTALGAAG